MSFSKCYRCSTLILLMLQFHSIWTCVCSRHVGLESEQEALLDFLVLARCRAFVGFGGSSFSYFLPQYKALQDLHAAPSVLIGHISEIFKLYGRIVDVGKLGPYVSNVENYIAGDHG